MLRYILGHVEGFVLSTSEQWKPLRFFKRESARKRFTFPKIQKENKYGCGKSILEAVGDAQGRDDSS